MTDDSSGELLARFVQGGLDAFESLYREYNTEVYQWAVRIVRDAGIAEDVLVDADHKFRGAGFAPDEAMVRR